MTLTKVQVMVTGIIPNRKVVERHGAVELVPLNAQDAGRLVMLWRFVVMKIPNSGNLSTTGFCMLITYITCCKL